MWCSVDPTPFGPGAARHDIKLMLELRSTKKSSSDSQIDTTQTTVQYSSDTTFEDVRKYNRRKQIDPSNQKHYNTAKFRLSAPAERGVQ